MQQIDFIYVTEGGIREAIAYGSMFNVIDAKSGMKADFWILASDGQKRLQL